MTLKFTPLELSVLKRVVEAGCQEPRIPISNTKALNTPVKRQALVRVLRKLQNQPFCNAPWPYRCELHKGHEGPCKVSGDDTLAKALMKR